MTAEQLRQKFPRASESFVKANATTPALSLQNQASASPKAKGKAKRSDGYDSQLEADWAVVMAERYGEAWRYEGVTLRLPDSTRYTPDFVSWEYTEPWDYLVITFWECKGPHRFRRAGIERFKRFAEQTPWARFVLVERENGQWKETEV